MMILFYKKTQNCDFSSFFKKKAEKSAFLPQNIIYKHAPILLFFGANSAFYNYLLTYLELLYLFIL